MGTLVRSGTHLNTMALLINSSGVRYGVFADSSGLYIYNNLDSTPASVTSQTNVDIFGSGTTSTIQALDAQLDGSGRIVVLVTPTDASEVYMLNRYDPGGGWLGWTTVIPSWAETPKDTNFHAALCVDANSYPGVLYTAPVKYKGIVQNYMYFRWYNYSTWSTPETVSSLSLDKDYGYPYIKVRGAFSTGNVDSMIWNVDNANWEIRNRNAGSWGTASAYTNGSVPVKKGGHDHIVYDSALYRYTAVNDNIYQNDADTGVDLESTLMDFSAAMVDGKRYVLGTSPTASDELDLLEYDGSWSAITGVEDAGSAVSGATLFNNYNRSSWQPTDCVPYLYLVSGAVYYGEYSLVTPANDSQAAFLKGRSDAVDNQAAYLQGASGGTATSDSQAAFLKGGASTSDNQSAFTRSHLGEVFRADHEEGDNTDWEGEVDTDGDLSITGLGALLGTYEVSLVVDDAVGSYLYESLSWYSQFLGYRFLIDPNSSLTNGEQITIAQIRLSSTPFLLLWVDFRKSSGAFQVRASTYDDTPTVSSTSWYTISDAPHAIELRHKRETVNGANNGQLEFYIDGQLKQTLTSIDDFLLWQLITQVRFGQTGTAVAPTTGTIYLDDFIIRDDYTLIGNPLGTATSDNQSAFLKGVDTASDNQIAFLAGSLDASDNQSAFLQGAEETQDNQAAYLAGLDYAVDNQSAFLDGSDTAVDNQAAFLSGSLDSSDNQTAFLQGSDNAVGVQSAFLQGSLDEVDNQAAYLHGSVEASDNTPAYLEGTAAEAEDNTPAYLAGVDTAVDNQSAYLVGSAEASDNQPAFLDGIDAAVTSQYAFLQGQDTALDNQPAYLVGHDFAVDNQAAYLDGSAEAVDNQPAYAHGWDTAEDNQTAFLAGSLEASDNQAAYLEGTAVEDSSYVHAFLKGVDTDVDSQSAFLYGSQDDVSNQAAYLAGSTPAVDNQPAFLDGQDTAVDNQAAFLVGGIETADNQSAFLHGAETASSNTEAYLAGSSDVVSSNTSAFLKGLDSDVDSQPAFLAGGLDELDNQAAYLTGQDLASSSQIAFLAGSEDTEDSQAGYLAGVDSAVDSTTAFLVGSIDTSATPKPAYLKGQDDSVDNQSAYLSGGIGTSSSVSAFMDACGEFLTPDADISQSGSWKREDDSTTNLYQSIDEQPGPNDSDYVWHESVAGAEYFEVRLSDPTYGNVGAGDVKIFWRGKRKSGTETVTMRVQLRQGTNVIAYQDQVFTDEDITYIYTLTSGEKASITDWTDLRLRFIVQGVV